MTQADDVAMAASSFSARVKDTIISKPSSGGSVITVRCPGVVDVMGGIAEESGSLVLTAAVGPAINAALWHTRDEHVHLRSATAGGNCELPVSAFDPSRTSAEDLVKTCREAGGDGWAQEACQTLRQAVVDGLVPRLERGLVILVQSDFPAEADLGRPWVQAATIVDGLCRLHDSPADRLTKSRACAVAVAMTTGLYRLRTSTTALCELPNGSLLQLRFQPQVLCQRLELPSGVMVVAARTHLVRPTTRQRLINARTCAEMGRRMIAELQRLDGAPVDPATNRLSTITPAEYVDRYRDRLPPKITGKAFIAKFGGLRGLDGGLDPQGTYKIRSRAEHHIYENRRVYGFATSLVRAHRNNCEEALIHAGGLMYASHWSHSQRCGIGGVEADHLVSAVRARGPAEGLFGAKVTGGGQGGEVVVMMRGDERARTALAEAVAAAEKESDRAIQTYECPPAGVESIQETAPDGEVSPTAAS